MNEQQGDNVKYHKQNLGTLDIRTWTFILIPECSEDKIMLTDTVLLQQLGCI